MKIQITITKDVIDRSLMCGTQYDEKRVVSNCAFALAYNDLVPFVSVGYDTISFYQNEIELESDFFPPMEYVKQTKEQHSFIEKFDGLVLNPNQRYYLVGQTFDVEIPDSIIEYWYQDAAIAAQKIADSRCLSLI